MLGATRERMLRELAEALEALTAKQPLVLVLEDLHWSDSATLDLVGYLARRRVPARLLVLGTYRPVEVIVREHPLHALKLDLTAAENLQFSVGLQHAVSAAQCHAALQALAIAQCADLPARVLSAGQRRRVALARLLLSKAPLWVLDEPITNLDVAGIALVESLLARHLEQGGMIVAAAHQPLLTGHAGTRSVQLH